MTEYGLGHQYTYRTGWEMLRKPIQASKTLSLFMFSWHIFLQHYGLTPLFP